MRNEKKTKGSAKGTAGGAGGGGRAGWKSGRKRRQKSDHNERDPVKGTRSLATRDMRHRIENVGTLSGNV